MFRHRCASCPLGDAAAFPPKRSDPTRRRRARLLGFAATCRPSPMRPRSWMPRKSETFWPSRRTCCTFVTTLNSNLSGGAGKSRHRRTMMSWFGAASRLPLPWQAIPGVPPARTQSSRQLLRYGAEGTTWLQHPAPHGVFSHSLLLHNGRRILLLFSRLLYGTDQATMANGQGLAQNPKKYHSGIWYARLYY